MAGSFRQSTHMGWYLMRQRLAKRERFPLLVELEPLFQCNLGCAGCGKIQHPDHILRQRMSVEQAVGAIEECGAPMVSIAGGEPLVHPEIHLIAGELVARRRFVYLCTNAILLERKLEKFTPSPYFAWAIHIDGLRDRHDASVEREGVFDVAVAAIKEAKARGFRVTTNTTFFTQDSPKTVREVLDFLNDELEVDEMMISPAYAYEKAPDQEHFLGVAQTRKLFSEAFADGGDADDALGAPVAARVRQLAMSSSASCGAVRMSFHVRPSVSSAGPPRPSAVTTSTACRMMP